MPRKRPSEMQREHITETATSNIKLYIVFEEDFSMIDYYTVKDANEAINKYIESNFLYDEDIDIELLVVEASVDAKVEKFKCKRQFAIQITKQ